MRTFDQHRRGGSERRERRFGLGHELLEPPFGAGDAEHADEGRLAGGGVLAGLFADQRRIAFDIEEIVGDLKRLADRRAVAFERVALRALAPPRMPPAWQAKRNSAPVFIACSIRTSLSP